MNNIFATFKMMGSMVGRSIIDERVIDFPINPIFWNLILNRPVSIHDISSID